MTDNFKSAEQNAPIDTRGPLPFQLPTLAYVPPEKRGQYTRTMDGSFRLSWITAGDNENMTHHVEAIAKGLVNVLPAGETPQSMAERDRVRAEMRAIFERELAAGEKREQDAFEARLRAKQQEENEKIAAEIERRRQSYGRRV
jgi:hypothetical protein